MMGKRNTFIQKVFISIFFFIILLPLMGMLGGFQPYELTKKRKKASLPQFNLKANSLDSLVDYAEDSYYLQNRYIDLNARVKFGLFNVSPNPLKVIIGKEDWLFYNYKEDKIFHSYSHQNLISLDSINTVLKEWEKRRLLCDSVDAKFLIAIWPNKSTVYEAYLPYKMLRQQKDTLSKLEQFVNVISNRPALDSLFIDMRKPFRKAQKEKQIYCKLDTHWNEEGAYLAYEVLMDKLSIPSIEREDFILSDSVNYSGDLVDIFGIGNQKMIKERAPHFQLKDTTIHVIEKKGTWGGSTIYINESVDNDLKVVIFGDSFTKALLPFLTLHFKEINFEWAPYNERYVKTQNPDIVLVCQIERFL